MNGLIYGLRDLGKGSQLIILIEEKKDGWRYGWF